MSIIIIIIKPEKKVVLTWEPEEDTVAIKWSDCQASAVRYW